MRPKFRMLSTVFAASLVMSTMASSAFAAEWFSEAPGWAQGGAALSESIGTVWGGTVKLTDNQYGPLHIKVAVECEASGEGSAGAGVANAETQWTLSKCVTVAGGKECESPEAGAVNLPWSSEMSYSKGLLLDTITSGGKGTPGFEMKCSGALGRKEDVCTGTLKARLTNGTGGVNAAFESKELSCTSGGRTSGAVEGSRLIKAAKGAALEAGVLSKVASALKVTATGELKVTDAEFLGGSGSVTCNFEAGGAIEAAGKGKISSILPSGCHTEGKCLSLRSVTAVNLPWGTELYSPLGEAFRNKIVSGGSGTPEWSFECETTIGGERDTCGLNTSGTITNTAEGLVQMAFGEKSNKTECSRGGKEAGTWQGTLTITRAEGVGGIRVK